MINQKEEEQQIGNENGTDKMNPGAARSQFPSLLVAVSAVAPNLMGARDGPNSAISPDLAAMTSSTTCSQCHPYDPLSSIISMFHKSVCTKPNLIQARLTYVMFD